MGFDHGRCNGNTNRQRKPHQHEAGDEVGVAQGLHAPIIAGLQTPGKDSAH
jgi:hypothetical protein